MNRHGKSFAMAAAVAMASMSALVPGTQPASPNSEARATRGDRVLVDEAVNLSLAGQRNSIAKAMLGGGMYGWRKTRYPNGPGWTHAHVARMKSKRRNQQRNKRAHRGGR